MFGKEKSQQFPELAAFLSCEEEHQFSSLASKLRTVYTFRGSHWDEILQGRPLVFAAAQGKLQHLHYLAKSQSHLMAYGNNMALRCASAAGHLDVVNWLLHFPEVRSNINDGQDSSALYLAITNNHLDVVNTLMKHPSVMKHITNNTNIFRAVVYSGNIQIVNAFLSYECFIHYLSKSSFDLLECSAKQAFPELFNKLLELKTEKDVLETTGDKYNFLYLQLVLLSGAIEGGSIDIVNIILGNSFVADNLDYESERFNLLYLAAHYGHLDVLNRLLQVPKIMEHLDSEGISALQAAACKGALDLVNRLLEFREVQDRLAADENDAVIGAASNGHVDVVNRLLEFPQVIEGIANQNNRLLFEAISFDNHVLFDSLLEFPEVVKQIAVDDNWILINAIDNGNPYFINRLLEFPDVLANIDCVENHVIQKAAETGNLELVNRLLEFPQVKVKLYHSLALAIQNGHIDVFNRLISVPEALEHIAEIHHSYLLTAAGSGHIKMIVRLLEFPHFVEHLADFENAVLIEAIQNNQVAVVDKLLEYPCVQECISRGLIYAIENYAVPRNQLQMINRLLDIKKIQEAFVFKRPMALLCACEHGHLELVNRLLEIPGIIDELDPDGLYNLLYWPAICGQLEVVDRLLQMQKIKDIVTHNDDELLQEVLQREHFEIAVRLLDCPELFQLAKAKGATYSAVIEFFIASKVAVSANTNSYFNPANSVQRNQQVEHLSSCVPELL